MMVRLPVNKKNKYAIRINESSEARDKAKTIDNPTAALAK